MSALTLVSLQEMCDASPYIHYTGLRVLSLDSAAGQTRFRMPWRAEFERGSGSGQWHGGPIAALIDSAGCMGVIAVDGRGAGTVNFRTDYLRPVSGAYLEAVAIVRKSGRTMGVADVDVFDSAGKLVATGRGTFFMESA